MTHQLVGIRLALKYDCGDATDHLALQAILVDRIERQLKLDPRLVDVYVQRLLMLVESGSGDRVKPIWVRRFLDVQRDDGGWADFHQLIPMPKDYDLGFTQRVLEIKRPRSGLHTTAQAIWLLSLLKSDQS